MRFSMLLVSMDLFPFSRKPADSNPHIIKALVKFPKFKPFGGLAEVLFFLNSLFK